MGLQLLNDLFNNDDFVQFVNELIDNFEGIEIIETENDETLESFSEFFMEESTTT